ncbi:SR-related and CTD-associated factor 4 isoform X1 [Drosophila subpulchrella]|uniref:SR-related and CTD-associated factor 4 isoform X1 n=1 Tax=Drosophila subpulchrella TaxID=1486046 RepID=UPI0018A17EEB|nr:SR-related and CTD-associated factor 4 isoform X1 [Drosophila subpulchrella]
METVVAFNNELSGLYDSRPPISKAKMAAITKSAMRAIKLYKHVVQSVEKFILKCKPEYKVPGLYVIDSIVRQSRHQYGMDKDLFAPRFQRNLTETFANLFRCAPEDKSRIIRVLNLWQKNNVFKSEVIQPIFDLADPNHPIYHQMPPVGVGGGQGGGNGPGPSSSGALSLADISSGPNGLNSSAMELSMNSSVGEDKMGGAMPDLSLGHEKFSGGSSSSKRHYSEQHYSKRQSGASSSSKSSKSHHHKREYVKSSHDLDYQVREIIEDEDDGMQMMADDHHCMGDDSPPTSSKLLDDNNIKQLLNDPNVLRQLQTIQNFHKFKQQEENQKHRYPDEALQQHFQNVMKGNAGMPPGMGMGMGMGMNINMNDSMDLNKDVEFISEQQTIEVINLDGADSRSPTPDRDRYKRSRRSSRTRSRSPRGRGAGGAGGGGAGNDRRRRSSRSRSRSRSPRSSRRRGSRDRERMDRNNRDKERDREHERERRKKGLPDIRKEHLSVCSTTLWVGHLSKLVYQEELSDTFGEYGDIVSIDQIVPRGCAFIVMNRRQDAHKAMQALKNHKLQGRAITISWAAGKGVKSKEWKDFWDLELGVTYIPWSKLSADTDFDALEEGGMFDEDTMPIQMKQKINQAKNASKDNKGPSAAEAAVAPGVSVPPPGLIFGIDTTQPPPVGPVGPVGPPPGPGAPPPPGLLGMVRGQFPMAPPMGINMPPPMMMPPTNMPPPMMMPTTNMPPPMMMPPAMMPPVFPGLGGPPHPMGLPPGAPFPPPGAVPPPMPSGGQSSANSGNVSDDQMDIEMDLEDAPPPPPQPQANFNPSPNNVELSPATLSNEMFQQRDRERDRERDRSRGPGSSRWGGRDDVVEAAERWRAENGGGGGGPGPGPAPGPGPNAAFNEARARLNLNPIDHGMPRPDFMDFDSRGGPPGGPRGMGPRGNHNGGPGGDFFPPNMNHNRFNQPTSLMQMRIPPPASFNQRMGGPPGNGGNGGGPMFMRNQGGGGGGGPGGGGPNGGPGGRQQGPGFFNPRNPFNDNQRGRGGQGGGGGRGMGGGGPGGRGRWSDDEDEGGNNFKRRGGPGGPGGNRFRGDRGGEMVDDRRGNNPRGGRGGPREDRERPGFGNRRGSRDDSNRHSISSTDDGSKPTPEPESRPKNVGAALANTNTGAPPANTRVDTEEDWDQELQDYEARMEAQKPGVNASQSANSPPQDKVPAENQNFAKPADVSSDSSVQKSQTDASAACTPLYDELPPPAVTQAQAQPSREASPPRPEPQVIHTEAAPKEESVPAPAAVLQTEAPSAEEPKTQAASADVASEADA